MDKMLMYLLEVNVLVVILTAIYFLIRNQLSYGQRRFSLLAIPVLAVLVFTGRLTGVAEVNAVYQLPVYELHALSAPPFSDQEHPTPDLFYDRIYVVGAVIALLFLFVRTMRVLLKLQKAKAQRIANLKVVHIENENCFSFLNYVQLNPDLSPEDREVVLQHEQIHISKKHSYDILFMEMMHGLNWFNPSFIALKKELISVHEYEVDQIMYSRHKTTYMEFLLAYSLRTNSTPYLLTNQFYSKKTLIKRMNFMKNKTKNRWAFALALPVVAASFALISWTFSEGRNPTPGFSADVERLEGEVEKMPEFKGGQEALVAYLSGNIKYPESAKEQKIEGKVIISFVVNTLGKVTKCKVKQGVHKDLDAEALRVVSGMPDWIPGEKDGKTVNAEMILPIAFKL